MKLVKTQNVINFIVQVLEFFDNNSIDKVYLNKEDYDLVSLEISTLASFGALTSKEENLCLISKQDDEIILNYNNKNVTIKNELYKNLPKINKKQEIKLLQKSAIRTLLS